jgi:hypothetical protein
MMALEPRTVRCIPSGASAFFSAQPETEVGAGGAQPRALPHLEHETQVNYNRIMLSSVLAGEKSPDDIILNGLDWYQQNSIDLRLG